MSAAALSTGFTMSGSLCSLANATIRSCSKPCGCPSGPTVHPAGPDRTATTSLSCGSSTGAGVSQPVVVAMRETSANRSAHERPGRATRAGSDRKRRREECSARVSRGRHDPRRDGVPDYSRRARDPGLPAVGCTNPAIMTSRAGCRVQCMSNRCADQRRVAPHCMVVNLVRSGRKQPKRFSASAGGTARHLSIDEKRVRGGCGCRRAFVSRFSSR